MHSKVVERACLQVTHALCYSCLYTNITLTIKLTGYKKKSKIGTDAAKLHTNVTSIGKHLLFIC